MLGLSVAISVNSIPAKSLDCFKENEVIVTCIIIMHRKGLLLVRLGVSFTSSDLSGFPDQLPQAENCCA